jgi:hypothetical protein
MLVRKYKGGGDSGDGAGEDGGRRRRGRAHQLRRYVQVPRLPLRERLRSLVPRRDPDGDGGLDFWAATVRLGGLGGAAVAARETARVHHVHRVCADVGTAGVEARRHRAEEVGGLELS